MPLGGRRRKVVSGTRRKRVKCMKCKGCKSEDCKICNCCTDMIKYGGTGVMRKSCKKRRCLQPQLPINAHCSVCKLDGWMSDRERAPTRISTEGPSTLMECTRCLDIVHFECARETTGMGEINEKLNNSWTCSKCNIAAPECKKFQRPKK